jgi:sigma-B regulation protein RsbU (phosphoserine phosphatase)
MKISLPAVPQSLEELRDVLGRALSSLPEEEAGQIVLAVQEAAANYIQHAEKAEAGCPLEVEITIDGRRLTVRIPLFCRKGVEKTILPRPLDQVRPGGLGTHFIQEIMDRVDYEPSSDGFMTLVLTKILGSGAGEGSED